MAKKKLLVVVDMQNDFISGALGTPEAAAIVDKVCEKISTWDGEICYTRDTHYANYPETNEGRHIPIEHCAYFSKGWMLDERIQRVRDKRSMTFSKCTFGSVQLAEYAADSKYDYIELVGLCTDICVISNAMLLRAYCKEATIVVDSACCAGSSAIAHDAALTVMKNCCVDVC